MAGLGQIFVEIDLDSTKFEAGQKQILQGASTTATTIEKNFKDLGAKSDSVYDQMRLAAVKEFDAIANAASSTNADILRAEEAKNETIKKLNDEQYKSSQETYDKIIKKLKEVGEEAMKVAEIIATVSYAFLKGSELGGIPGGLFAGGIAIAAELTSVLGAANAEAADLDVNYQKLYDTKQKIQTLSLTDQQINQQINALVGDQIASWDKIKNNLPDIVNQFLDMNKAMNTTLGTPNWSFDSMIGDVAKFIDDTVNLFQKPKSEIEKLYESATESQQRALATQYLADKKAVQDSTATYQEKADAMKMINLKYLIDSKAITAKGTQEEIQSYQSVFEKIGSVSESSSLLTSAAMTRVVDVMKQKYGEMLRAQEDFDAVLMGDKDKAHELMLAKEQAYGDKLVKAIEEYQQRALEAQRKASGADVLEQEVLDAGKVIDKLDADITASTQMGHSKRLQMIKDEVEARINAAITAKKSAEEIDQIATNAEKIAAEKYAAEADRMKPKMDTSAADEYAKSLKDVTNEYYRLTMAEDDNKKRKVWADWEGQAAKMSEYALAARDLALAEIDETGAVATARKKSADDYRVLMANEYDYAVTAKEREANKIIAQEAEKLRKLKEIMAGGGITVQQYADAEVKIKANAAAAILLKTQENLKSLYDEQLKYIELLKGPYSDEYTKVFQSSLEMEAELLAKKIGAEFDKEKWITARKNEELAKRLDSLATYYNSISGMEEKATTAATAAIAMRKKLDTITYGDPDAASKKASQSTDDQTLKTGTYWDGWIIGIKEADKEFDKWAKKGKDAFETVNNAGKSSLSQGLFDVMKGDMNGFQNAWSSFCDSLLKKWTDLVAEMAMHSITDMFKGAATASGTGSALSKFFSVLGGDTSGGSSGYTEVGADPSGMLPTASAFGNVFSGSGISAYSNSIVSQPTYFPFASGMGLMGERGAEAIMPLKRMPGGDLGIKAETSSTAPNVSVNIVNNTPGNVTQTPKVSFSSTRQLILDVVLDGVNRNINNFGTNLGLR